MTNVTRVEWTVVWRVGISNTGTSSAAEEALSWTFQLFKWRENMPLLPAVFDQSVVAAILVEGAAQMVLLWFVSLHCSGTVDANGTA